MEFNSKIADLLKLLCDNGGEISIEKTIKAKNFTKRTLYYNIEKLNYFLSQNGFSKVEFHGDKLTLDISENEDIRNFFKSNTFKQYFFLKEERSLLMTVAFGFSSTGNTLERLSNLFDISRNTARSEIEHLKTHLANKNIQIVYEPKKGHVLKGDEISIRNCIYESYCSLNTKHTLDFANYIIFESLKQAKTINFEDINELLSQIQSIIKWESKSNFAAFSYSALSELTIYLLLLISRSEHKANISAFSQIERSEEYAIAKRIIKAISAYGLIASQGEIHYFAAVLQCVSLSKMNNSSSPREHSEVEQIVNCILSEYAKNSSSATCNDNNLANALILHIRPLYYRQKYNIFAKPTIWLNIKNSFKSTFSNVNLAVNKAQKKHNIIFCVQDVNVLCLFFENELEKEQIKHKQLYGEILIVCDSDIVVSLYLKKQISALLGAYYSYTTIDYNDFDKNDINKYAIIITSADFNIEGENVFVVNNTITNYQNSLILKYVRTHINAQTGLNQAEHILRIISQYAKIEDPVGLELMINQFFEKTDYNNKKRGLKDIFDTSMIKICDEVLDYKGAVQLSCKALEDCGIVDETYKESIIDILNSLGLYAEFIPGVLLLHAKPTVQVKDIGLALTVFTKEIDFAKWGRKIHAIFTFCAFDSESHITMLSQLMNSLSHKQTQNMLCEEHSLSKEKLYNAIVQQTERKAGL